MQVAILDFGAIENMVSKMTAGASAAIETEPVMDKISVDMFRIEREIFGSQGRRGGGSWKPLKESTVKRKGNAEILKGTGDNYLFRSLTVPGAEFQILNIGRSEIEFGTRRPFAYVHQTGSMAPKIPRRPFLRFLPSDVDRWSTMLFNHLIAPFKADAGKTV